MKNKKITVTAEVGSNETKHEKLKTNFFQKFWYSITKFEKYPDMAAEGVYTAIRYLLVLVAIFAIIVSGITTYKTSIYVSNIMNYVENDLPNFTYSDEKLKVDSEEAIVQDKSDLDLGLVVIDTNTNTENSENDEKIDEYKSLVNSQDDKYGMVILENEVIMISGDTENKYQYSKIISSLGIDTTEFSKDSITSYVTGNKLTTLYGMYFVEMFIYYIIIYALTVFVDSVVLAVLGFITTIFAKLKMKFLAIYNMAVYSLTLSVLFSMLYTIINMFTTFNIQYFQVMYISIAYIYLVTAIFLIKADFVKKQAELEKVKEEQKKVREELEKQEDNKDKKENKEDKEEKKDTDNKDKKDEKKKNKKNEKDNNLGETPEESNA